MGANEFMQLVSTLGFPIVCCGGMAWYVKYITDKNREQIDKILEQHKKEISEVTTALNNNTIAITQLTDYIKKEE